MGKQASWKLEDAPSQAGKVALVTGATGGLGAVVAAELAGLGAEVVLAGRSEANGAAQVASINRRFPNAKASFERLDVSDLGDVRRFAELLESRYPRLDVLVANAGTMAPPKRSVTADGIEVTFATNHLGHFALIGRLLPRLSGTRIVLVGSVMARTTDINLDDIQYEKRAYPPTDVYSQSKLISLLFARELDRRSREGGWGLRAVASHPGFSRTGFASNSPLSTRITMKILHPFIFQRVSEGALPLLRAATEPELPSSAAYFGPQCFFELWKGAVPVPFPRSAEDDAAAKRLWELSEELSGVSYGK